MTHIAIVGMSCRFRGARDVNEFWRLMRDASPQFDSVPEGRWRRESFHDPKNPRAPFTAYTDQVAFLDEVEQFAPLHYGLPPKRAHAVSTDSGTLTMVLIDLHGRWRVTGNDYTSRR